MLPLEAVSLSRSQDSSVVAYAGPDQPCELADEVLILLGDLGIEIATEIATHYRSNWVDDC